MAYDALQALRQFTAKPIPRWCFLQSNQRHLQRHPHNACTPAALYSVKSCLAFPLIYKTFVSCACLAIFICLSKTVEDLVSYITINNLFTCPPVPDTNRPRTFSCSYLIFLHRLMAGVKIRNLPPKRKHGASTLQLSLVPVYLQSVTTGDRLFAGGWPHSHATCSLLLNLALTHARYL